MNATLLAECLRSCELERPTNRISDPPPDPDVIMTDVDDERELSALESLPGELLNRIYRYAVVKDGMAVASNRIPSSSVCDTC